MPSASKYDPNDKALRDAADAEFKNRRAMIAENRRYYDGDLPKPLADDKDNVIINLCRQVVDETVAFLLPDMPTLELDDQVLDRSDDEEWVQQLWERNGGTSLLSDMGTNGSAGGQVYSRIIPSDDYPKIVNLDPANCITFWDDDDATKVRWYELRWGGGDNEKKLMQGGTTQRKEYRQDVIAVYDAEDKHISHWELIDFTRTNNGMIGGQWEIYNTTLWEYAIGPVVDWNHLPDPNSYYGADEYRHKALNDSINRVLSDINAIIRYHASPTTFLLGINEKNAPKQVSIDGVYVVEGDPNGVDVKTIEMQGDLTASTNLVDRLISQFYAQSRVVIVRGGFEAFRGMTNLGIRSAFMPMIAKNATLRRMYGKGIDLITRLCLDLVGKEVPDRVNVKWGEALPTDTVAEFNLIRQMELAGYISKQTASERLGNNYKAEQAQIVKEMSRNAMIAGGQFPGTGMDNTPNDPVPANGSMGAVA